MVAPLTEDLFSGGFVMTGFHERYRPGTAIVLSALLFSVLHVNPYQIFGAFALGLIMGWLRWRTGSPWPCIALHAAANGTVLAAGNLPTITIPGFTPGPTHSFQPPWFDLLGLALAVAGLGLLVLLGPPGPAGPAPAETENPGLSQEGTVPPLVVVCPAPPVPSWANGP